IYLFYSFTQFTFNIYFFFFFFFNDTATTEIYTLSLHDALPISRPSNACVPTMMAVPTMPATTPISLRDVAGSCRVIVAVMRKVKIGEVELRMVASPATTSSSAQAIKVNGTTLLRQAWNRNRRQVAPSRGNVSPRQRSTVTRMAPAIRVRAAIKVTGGMVATPSLMKV